MQQSSPSATFKIGGLFGVGWGIVLILNGLLSDALNIRWNSLIAILISLAVFFVAGMLAAQRTGKVSSGLVAGLFAGLFSGLINNVVSFILLATNNEKLVQLRDQAQQAVDQNGQTFHYTTNLILIGAAFGLLFTLVISALVGLGLGALGGVAGKSRAPLPPQSYQEAMYPGGPPSPYGAPGYPQYPQGQMPGAPGAPGGWPQQPPPAQGSGGWPQQPPQQ
jgi:hypothetical protein